MYYFINVYYTPLHSSGSCPCYVPLGSSFLPCSAQGGQSTRGNQHQAHCLWTMYLELALTWKIKGREKIGRFFFFNPHKLFHSCTIARSDEKGEFKKCTWGPRENGAIPFGWQPTVRSNYADHETVSLDRNPQLQLQRESWSMHGATGIFWKCNWENSGVHSWACAKCRGLKVCKLASLGEIFMRMPKGITLLRQRTLDLPSFKSLFQSMGQCIGQRESHESVCEHIFYLKNSWGKAEFFLLLLARNSYLDVSSYMENFI